jgi:sporulation protein YlmC with PRC-barrel domain
MKKTALTMTVTFLLLCAGFASAQQTQQRQQQGQPPGPVAGVIPLGVTVQEMHAVVLGWSVRNNLLGKTVSNDKNQRIGRITDIIITPNDAASFAIIGVAGFLGIPERQVAIPMRQIKLQNGKLVLPGATKDALKKQPPFIYAH